jgi:hypothetical protein
MLEFYESNPDFIRLLMFSALESHQMGDMFGRRYREILLGTVRDYIDLRIRQGGFRKLNSALAARAFAGMVANFGQSLVLFPSVMPKMSRQDLICGMVDIFLNGMTRNRQAPARRRKR